jgi:hypothetical protein
LLEELIWRGTEASGGFLHIDRFKCKVTEITPNTPVNIIRKVEVGKNAAGGVLV